MVNGYGSAMGWTWLFWLLLIVGIVLLVIFAVRTFSGGITRTGTMGQTTARRILDERYAQGELSTAEYRERLKALGDDA